MKMRKMLKALIAAAGLAVISTMTVLAANGWVQENGR